MKFDFKSPGFSRKLNVDSGLIESEKRNRVKFFSFFLFLLTASLTIGTNVWADGPGDFLHTRTYIGVFGTSISIDKSGEFSGTNYSRVDNPGYEITAIPSLAQNFGFAVLLGHREEAYALELSYWQSNHLATFGPTTLGAISGQSATFTGTYQAAAVLRSVNVDFKRYFLTDLNFQPFVSLGVGFPWLDIPDADGDGAGHIYPVTLAGLGFDLGLGAEYYLSPALSIVGSASHRWASFDQLKGYQGLYNQMALYGSSTGDSEGGFIFAIGTTLGFE